MFKRAAIYLMLAISLMACEGPMGVDGPDGPAGSPGADGNANVIYSDWISAGPWSGGGTSSASIFIPDAAITDELINTSDFRVYYRGGPNDSRALPLPATFGVLDYVRFYNFAAFGPASSTGAGILISVIRSDGGIVDPPESIEFRYVITLGSTHRSEF